MVSYFLRPSLVLFSWCSIVSSLLLLTMVHAVASSSAEHRLYFGAKLSSYNVVPIPRKPGGSGTFYLMLNTKTKMLHWSLDTDLIHTVQVLLRLAPPNQVGTPILALSVGHDLPSTMSGKVSVATKHLQGLTYKQFVSHLRQGQLAIVVYNSIHRLDGAVRGQLKVIEEGEQL
eukprot:TRINITY_DN467_c0_g1_i4.p1 TRINITY_DN467_c0_g1~~TRINITY_DN467_c0_g1_i4.p1  ORF type:complete len:203 (-),score=39.53 TRINITY_DN467_c0_g1_i4:185-703(-)